MLAFAIFTLLYLAAGVYMTKQLMKDVDEQLTLYTEKRYKEIDDDKWESVKDTAKMKEQLGEKTFNYIMFPILTLVMPVVTVYYFIKELPEKAKDYWTKGRFQKIKNGTQVRILEKGRYDGEDHYLQVGEVEGFLPAHMTPHKQDIYMIGFEDDDIDTRFAYEPDKFKVV